MLVLLERLSPVERAAYLLREVFGYGYAEIAVIIEQTAVDMAAVSQPRPASSEFESRRVRVNGQPGRLLRGPTERPFREAERLAVEKTLALMRSDDVDANQLAALVKDAREAGSGPARPAVPQQQAGAQVWSVLTVDVVEGPIQTVRIVRNPDKLGHL